MKGQSLQDPYLNALRKERIPVSIYLVSGIKLQGQDRIVRSVRRLGLRNSVSQMVYKHAISTVVPARNVDLRGERAERQGLTANKAFVGAVRDAARRSAATRLASLLDRRCGGCLGCGIAAFGRRPPMLFGTSGTRPLGDAGVGALHGPRTRRRRYASRRVRGVGALGGFGLLWPR